MRLLFAVPWIKAHEEIVSLSYVIVVPSGFGALPNQLRKIPENGGWSIQ